MINLLLASGALGRLYLEFIYITILGIGIVGLGFSLMFGDHDADSDHDADTEHDTDHDGDHDGDHDSSGPGNMSFLSLKVIWSFLVGAGGGGYLGALKGLGSLGSLGTATLAGLVMAVIGYSLMNAFYRGQSSSTVRSASLVGALAVVDTNIPEMGNGRIQISTPTGSVLMLAESTNHERLPEGTRVKVTDVIGPTCFVVRS